MKNIHAFMLGVVTLGIFTFINIHLLYFIKVNFSEYATLIYFSSALLLELVPVFCIVAYINYGDEINQEGTIL
jgi:hypothetical protein